MLCPRCINCVMEEQERQGVTIDVCGKCRGVFLDRGELEKLNALAEPHDERSPRIDDEDDDERRDGERGPGNRQRGGLLARISNLFD